MTQPTVNQGGTAVAEPPAPFLPAGQDEAGAPDNRRKLLVVGGVVAVLVVVAAAFFLLKGHGSSTSSGSSGLIPHGHPKAAAVAAKPAAPVTLPKQLHAPVGRDPFKALYVAPAPVVSAAPKPVSAPSTSGGSSQPSVSSAPPPAAFAPVWIELVSVNGTKSATFIVGYSNGRSTRTSEFFNVQAPRNSLRTDFASVFALLSIQDNEATVQFGDGAPFDLLPGARNRHVVG